MEHYDFVAEKPEIINKSFTASFTGKGIINGALNVNAEGNFVKTFRNNETVYFQGNGKFV